jgi:hypothetical protein
VLSPEIIDGHNVTAWLLRGYHIEYSIIDIMYFSVPKRRGLAGLHEAWPPKSQPGLQAAKEPAGRQVFCYRLFKFRPSWAYAKPALRYCGRAALNTAVLKPVSFSLLAF